MATKAKRSRQTERKARYDRSAHREYWRDRISRWEEEMVAITRKALPNFTAEHVDLADRG